MQKKAKRKWKRAGKVLTRKETTEFLTDLLIVNKLSERGKYYAREVVVDYGTSHPKRVDVMQFEPEGVLSVSSIEKGNFICYEIKSSYEDIYSGHGLNFLGEENWIVTTMETYKKCMDGKGKANLDDFIRKNFPESSLYYGFMVAVPGSLDLRKLDDTFAEFENPSALEEREDGWKLYKIYSSPKKGGRKRSSLELMFCMLRSKHNYTNQQDNPSETD